VKSLAISRTQMRHKSQIYSIGVLLTIALIFAQTITASARGAGDSFADLAERHVELGTVLPIWQNA